MQEEGNEAREESGQTYFDHPRETKSVRTSPLASSSTPEHSHHGAETDERDRKLGDREQDVRFASDGSPPAA